MFWYLSLSPDICPPIGSRKKKQIFYGQADRKGRDGLAPSALTVSKCENTCFWDTPKKNSPYDQPDCKIFSFFDAFPFWLRRKLFWYLSISTIICPLIFVIPQNTLPRGWEDSCFDICQYQLTRGGRCGSSPSKALGNWQQWLGSGLQKFKLVDFSWL